MQALKLTAGSLEDTRPTPLAADHLTIVSESSRPCKRISSTSSNSSGNAFSAASWHNPNLAQGVASDPTLVAHEIVVTTFFLIFCFGPSLPKG